MLIIIANNLCFGSIEGLGTQGPEDEFRTQTLGRFLGELRSETLRLAVKEYSEPFACKRKTWQRRTSISVSIRRGPRASAKTKPYEFND